VYSTHLGGAVSWVTVHIPRHVAITLIGTVFKDPDFKVRFEVLTAMNMKMTVFCDIPLDSLAEVYRRFRDAYCPHYQGEHR
jgi:hypothetical protein